MKDDYQDQAVEISCAEAIDQCYSHPLTISPLPLEKTMRKFLLIVAVAILSGCGSNAPVPKTEHGDSHKSSHGSDHETKSENATLMVETSPSKIVAGKPTDLSLMLHDKKGAMLKEFDEVHEKKIHLIIVRDGLDLFDHVHPQLLPNGKFTINFTFPVGGLYRLYADFKPREAMQNVAIAEVQVEGEAPKAPQLSVNVPGKVKGDGLNAKVAMEKATASLGTKVVFELTDDSGSVVKDLETYLGAMGHLVVLSQDGKQFVHAHPVDRTPAESKGKVSFEVHFPGSGLYKGWGQFQRGGKVFAIPFVVEIMK